MKQLKSIFFIFFLMSFSQLAFSEENKSPVPRMTAEELQAFIDHQASLQEPVGRDEIKDILKRELKDRIREKQNTTKNDSNQVNCKEEFSEVPPFLISKVDKGTAGTEKYMSAANGNRKVTVKGDSSVLAQENFHFENQSKARRISRGTLVTLRGSEEDIKANLARLKAGGKGFRVPVTVTSPNETYQQFTDQKNEVPFVAKNDEGLLWSKSMSSPTKDDRFIVMEDSYLLPDLKDQNLKGKGLEPIVDEVSGKYKINKCRRMEEVVRYATDGSGDPVLDGNGNPARVVQHDERGNEIPAEKVEKCQISHMYTIVGASGDQSLNGKVISIDHSCFEAGIRPVKKDELDQYENMVKFMNENHGTTLSLDQLEFNDWGKAKLPLDNLETANISDSSINAVRKNGKFVYYKNSDAPNIDNWGNPTTICSLYNLTDKFFEKCKETPGRSDEQCMARVGDMSFITPVNKHNPGGGWKNKDPLDHKSHHTGNCIDLRPFRNDDDFGRLEHTYSTYDREITQEFVNMAKKFGANNILFNDSKIKGAARAGGHDNHLHICFPPKNKTVKESCSQRSQKRTPASAGESQ